MTLRSTLARDTIDGVGVMVDGRDGRAMVAFTDRRGGVSSSPYDSLNLAQTVGDDAAAVAENRRRAADAIGLAGLPVARARQVHGCAVVEVAAGNHGTVGVGDVLVTSAPGVVLAILTADCAPVALLGDRGVCLVHAGWRGLAAGVVEAGLSAVGEVTRAWIGPAIGSCCYEVGDEVVAAFSERGLPTADGRVAPADAAASVLERHGVGEITLVDECTSCNRDFFSHRRDGVTGRQGAFIVLTA